MGADEAHDESNPSISIGPCSNRIFCCKRNANAREIKTPVSLVGSSSGGPSGENYHMCASQIHAVYITNQDR